MGRASRFSASFIIQCIFSRGSTLKEKNLLLSEQILSLRVDPYLERFHCLCKQEVKKMYLLVKTAENGGGGPILPYCTQTGQNCIQFWPF